MPTPTAFISYSHDSLEHKKWVLMLATRLREAGVDAMLDLWELEPGADLAKFMEQSLAKADRVLMICSENYVSKANAGIGGVGYEKMIVTADYLRNIDSKKVIPIVRQNGTRNVPTFLTTKLYLDFSREDQFEFGFDELTRTLHNAPLLVKPKVGNKPFPSSSNTLPTKTGDPILKVMKLAVQLFESSTRTEYFAYSTIARSAQEGGMSRMYFDLILNEVIAAGLIEEMGGQYLSITDDGKSYAFEHSLV